jgi:hypothetical protein
MEKSVGFGLWGRLVQYIEGKTKPLKRKAPLRRLERRHLPSEGSALSTELQGRVKNSTIADLFQFEMQRRDYADFSTSKALFLVARGVLAAQRVQFQ